ncbi:MAG TPA: NAD(+) diphosphatase [Rhizomicrobium sp.]|jgi:NAD+ diphosphatase|nr:NAD(+) diphosphatase [Rhizomicrobium sp.]
MLSFTGNPLDRASEERADPAWVAAQRQRPEARFLPLWQAKLLLKDQRVALLTASEIPAELTSVFLGLQEGQPLFAVAMPDSEMPPLGNRGEYHDMRAAAFILPDADTAIAGQAKALIDWHRRHGFCPNCGAGTEIQDGGYRRVCPQCGAEHFPRTDPVVIMLPVFGEECLLGHNKRFPEGFYSAFAGFLEPGETMEEGVKRELKEEAELEVGEVRYHASQPWPFPSSLMLGCYAQARAKHFRIDGREIESARWMGKTEIRERLAGGREDGIKLPAVIAIANKLIADWVDRA